jgi:hypothetical protein
MSRWRDSNPRPVDYKSTALASELHRQSFKEQNTKKPPQIREGKCTKEIGANKHYAEGKKHMRKKQLNRISYEPSKPAYARPQLPHQLQLQKY